MVRLYEIDAIIRDLEARAIESSDEWTGEIPADIYEAIDEAIQAREGAVLDLACILKERRAEVAAIKAEAAKLAQRARAAEARCERLEAIIEEAVPVGERRHDARVTVSWRKSEQVEVACSPGELPALYQRVRVEADKVGLKGALRAGAEVPGVALVEVQNLQVK